MTQSPTGAPSDPAEQPERPRVTREQATDLSRLVRTSSASPENRYLAGVAGGIARHLDIDPLIVRILLVVAAFFGGAGVILYIAGWLFIPEEKDGSATVTVDARSRNVVLWVAVLVAGLAAVGDVAGGVDTPWWLIPVVIVLLVLTRVWDVRDSQGKSVTDGLDSETREVLAEVKATTQSAVTQIQESTERSLARARERASNRRGPILFWFTMALVGLAELALAVADGAGASVAPPAYPALALGLIGLMLVVGSFWGRAGGLILAGLIAAACLGSATASDHWDGEHRIHQTPLTASAVVDQYKFTAGQLTLDLTNVQDLAALNGRTISVRGTVGELVVIAPPQIGVRATAEVSGVGEIDLFGHEQGGISIDASGGTSPAAGQPTVAIDAHVTVGKITITTDPSEALDD